MTGHAVTREWSIDESESSDSSATVGKQTHASQARTPRRAVSSLTPRVTRARLRDCSTSSASILLWPAAACTCA